MGSNKKITIHNHIKKQIKRVISFVIIMTILATAMPPDFISDGWSVIKEVLAEETKTTPDVKIATVDDLINLSQQDASTYEYSNISIVPSGEAFDLSSASGFTGLGSADHPFQGSVKYNGNVSSPFILSKALFNYISDSATIGTASKPIYLSAASNTTNVVLASNVIPSESSGGGDIYVAIGSSLTDSNNENSYSSFGGILGELGADASISISVTNNIPTGYTTVKGVGDVGFLCNTMDSNSSLTLISYSGDDTFNVTASKVSSNISNIGSLVGQMQDNATLNINTAYSYSGNTYNTLNSDSYVISVGGIVGKATGGATININAAMTIDGTVYSSKSTTSYAGGIAGYSNGLEVCFDNDSTVKLSGTVYGQAASGGLIGYYDYSQDKDQTWELSNYTIDTITFPNGTYTGGIFGILTNDTDSRTISLVGESFSTTVKTISSEYKNYGGLIGKYSSNDLKAALIVSTLTIKPEFSNKDKNLFGGAIAHVTGDNYIQVDNVVVNTTTNSKTCEYYGGIVGYSDGNSMFDIGTVTVKASAEISIRNSASGTIYQGFYGGIIARMNGGVLRLSGTTDLSGINPNSVNMRYGQLVGGRNNALIYAVGTGNNYNEETGSGWTFIRNNSGRTLSDVAAWGEVVRIDGTNLTEEIVKEDVTGSTDRLLIYNSVKHTVTVEGFYSYDEDNIGKINTVQNFAAIALTYQLKGASGALKLSSDSYDVSKWTISLLGDIDLSGTGINGFQRDNSYTLNQYDSTRSGGVDASTPFTGTLDGNSHTIKLAVGETYGTTTSTTDSAALGNGCGQIYFHKYIGLFAQTADGCQISNVTISGNINFGNLGDASNSNTINYLYYLDSVLCGGVVANHTAGTISFNNVTSNIDISFHRGTDMTNNLAMAYVGGFIGVSNDTTTVSFDTCTWNGNIYNYCNSVNYYIGGYLAYIANESGNTNISINNCKATSACIKAIINASNTANYDKHNYSKIGGLLAGTGSGTGKLTIKLNGFNVDAVEFINSASNASGGFLGYEWNNVDLSVNGLVINDSKLTLNQKSGFGGLVYKASGYWEVYGDGIKFTGTNILNGSNTNSTPSAMLVCLGYDYLKNDKALYMEIAAGAYTISAETKVYLNNNTQFDEIVGKTISADGCGIVSIATSDNTLIDQNAVLNTYVNQLKTFANLVNNTAYTKTYNNPYTRYYYNLDTYRLDDGSAWADNDINSSKELLVWSVAQYCEENLKQYFIKDYNATTNLSVTMSGDLDLSGYSYYPVDYSGKITIKDATITFDYASIETVEKSKSNRQPSVSTCQHYMMQTGLFLSVTSTKDVSASMTISGESGLVLKGNIGQLSSNTYNTYTGSGALICGKAEGTIDDTTVRSFSFSVDSDSKIILDGIKVNAYSGTGYAPLLINSVGSYSALNFVNVSYEKESYTTDASVIKAASSLIGTVGGETAKNIVLLFENINLNGKTSESIFSIATFVGSFSYDINDLASSGTYNFNSDDESVTYGQELSNGINNNGTTGRNPYDSVNLTGQIWYHDTINEEVVSDGEVKADEGDGFFNGNYLPYIGIPEGGTSNDQKYYHELDINQPVYNLTEGCGTYDDPYIITDGKQLEAVANFISTHTSAGWKVNICYDIANSDGSTSFATHCVDDTDNTDESTSNHYEYTSGSVWTTSESDNETLTQAQALAYMRNAYYMIEDSIELGSSFYGIGGSDPNSDVFSGVIIGKEDEAGNLPTVTIKSHEDTTHSFFGGLIAYSEGSVVKDLIINYENAALTLTAKAASQERSEQSFFGGVIGYVVGGDNIIDNVDVVGLDRLSLTILGTDITETVSGESTVTGSTDQLTAIGGYVGLVGGNTSSGGGVIFRNITAKGFTGEEFEENTSESENTTDYYYRNPYVGRVLDGYAFAENCTLNNTNKNYKIPTLTEASDDAETKLQVSASDGSGQISIASAQQLWVLSAIVNSGAGGMNRSYQYNSDAYKYGLVRTGTYKYVGAIAPSKDSDDYAEYLRDLEDCKYWGGIEASSVDTDNSTADNAVYKYDENKVSYLVYAYSNTAAAFTTGGSYNFSLTFNSDCDMTSYGNGFRGVGSSYQDNADAEKIQNRSIYFGGTIKGATKNSTTDDATYSDKYVTITLNRDVKEYSFEKLANGGWWTQGIGLFPVINFAGDTVIDSLTVSGVVNINYAGASDYIGEASAGGFAGMTSNRGTSTASSVKWNAVCSYDLVIKGAKYTGALIGVVGQSSRTTASGFAYVGSTAGKQSLTSCSYSEITLEGGYAAGGYFGVCNAGTVTIKGDCNYTKASIGWVKDACLEMYSTLTKKSDNTLIANTREDGYSGAGGLVGSYQAGDLTINSSKEGELNFDTIEIYCPKFAYTCDYGMGLISGLQKTGKVTAYNITTNNITVKIDKTLDYNQQYNSRDGETEYYYATSSGTLFGYVKQNITLSNISISNSYIVDGGFTGGVLGISNSSVTITDLTMKDCYIYSQGGATWDGSVKVGGIIGTETGSKLNLTNCYLENVNVVSDGRTSLVMGYTRINGGEAIRNFKASNCNVVVTNNASALYYTQSDTKPNNSPKTTTFSTDNTCNSAGLLLGAAATNSQTSNFDKIPNGIIGYNLLFDNCTVGYYCPSDGEDLTFTSRQTGEYGEEWSFNVTLDSNSVGVYVSEDNGKPYSEVMYSEENSYSDGNQGILIGGTTFDSTVKIVGLSINGGDLPCELNGNGDLAINNTKSNNYIIYTDYDSASATDSSNKAGTTNNNIYDVEASDDIYKNASSSNLYTTVDVPYTTVNPLSDITVYHSYDTKKKTLSKKTVLTGDTFSAKVRNNIINDVAGSSSSKAYNLTYYRVENIIKKFASGGEYADNLGMFYEASETSKETTNNMADFPVLVIESTDSSEITTLIRNYISMYTNCVQTENDDADSDDTKTRYSSVDVKTYAWNTTAQAFVAVSTSVGYTLTYDGTTKMFSINGNRHDNQNNQFTLIDIRYQNSVYTSEYYHLYIPVVVRRVVQVDFSVKMLTGSSTYDSIYKDGNSVLVSYGENFTAQLTYSYNWTAAEWKNYINSGRSMLWSYDKQVQLGDNNSGGDLKLSTTQFTLVDINKLGKVNTYFTGNGSILTADADSDSVLQFNSLTDSDSKIFDSIPICDMLTLKATKDDKTGTLKYIGQGALEDDYLEGASIRIWDYENNVYQYYGPTTEDDASDIDLYSIDIMNGDTAFADSDSVKVNEQYYLIINCTVGSDVNNRLLTLGELKLTSTDENALPNRKGTYGTKFYTLGDFFVLDDISITSSSLNGSNIIDVSNNDSIEVEVSSTVGVSQNEDVLSYIENKDSFFCFAISMTDSTSNKAIDADIVSVEEVKIGDNNLDETDYDFELVSGIWYLIIKSQTADKFENQVVYAKIQFNYAGNSEKISSQFPEGSASSADTGVSFALNAAIAYNRDSLDGSKMAGSNTEQKRYYREKIEVVSLSYNAYNTVSEDGNTSQLGINGREVEDVDGQTGQTIRTLGMFNATGLSSLNTTDASSDKYPAKLICTLSLQKKVDDAGTTAYTNVNIGDYISSFNLTSGDATITKEMSGKFLKFTVNLTKEQIENLNSDQLDLDIAYFVKGNGSLETLDDGQIYSNYKVILSVYLVNQDGKDLTDSAEDYLIYTNAYFYLGILSTGDFDAK